jgi:hypothetical protein
MSAQSSAYAGWTRTLLLNLGCRLLQLSLRDQGAHAAFAAGPVDAGQLTRCADDEQGARSACYAGHRRALRSDLRWGGAASVIVSGRTQCTED